MAQSVKCGAVWCCPIQGILIYFRFCCPFSAESPCWLPLSYSMFLKREKSPYTERISQTKRALYKKWSAEWSSQHPKWSTVEISGGHVEIKELQLCGNLISNLTEISVWKQSRLHGPAAAASSGENIKISLRYYVRCPEKENVFTWLNHLKMH